jgi:uncharacterized protein with GYD domain
MATFVALCRYTEEGIKNIRQFPQKVEEWQHQAKELGIPIKELFWLQGEYDAMFIIQSDNEEAVNALLMSIAAQGFLRTETLRAFTTDEVRLSEKKLAVAGSARK